MALVKGVNSYGDLTEANEYFATRLDVAAWDSASEELRIKALVTASKMFNEKIWIGVAVSDAQRLAFPREGYYFSEIYGREISFNGTPVEIVEASFEQAYHLLNNDGLLDSASLPDNIEIGPISIERPRQAPRFSTSAYQLFAPFLEPKSTSRTWWRAN